MKKRLFTLLLAVVMVLSLFPALSQTAEAAEYYDLWVDGVRVSSANCSDILGDGSTWYTPSTQTLWVYNANITTPYTFDTGENRTAFVYSDGIDLTIRGSATITGIGNYGINVSNGTLTVNADLNITLSNSGNFYAAIAMKCTDDITIRGGTMNLTTTHGDIYAPAGDITIIGGRLTLKGGGIYSAIEAKGSVTITDGVEYVDATSSYGAIRSDASSISIGSGLTVTEPANPVYGEFVYQSDGSTKATHVVTAQAYSLWVGGVQVNVMNRDDILGDGGKAQYNPDTNTLTLNNPSITNTYSESVSKPKLFIYANSMNLKVVGSATMSGPANFGIRVLYGTLTVDGDFNIDPKYPNNGYSTTALAGWNGVSILGGTMVLTGDSDVVEARYGDITISGGSVTATGRSTNYAALCAQSGDVIITNGVRCVEATGSTAGAIGAGTDHSVVLGDALSVTEPADAVIGQNVYESDGSTKARHVVIVPAYDLWVGGVQVTGLNKDDILGDGGKARFDPATTTLTLDNPTLNGSHGDKYNRDAAIYSELTADLTLEGRGTIGNSKYTFGVYAQSDAEGNGGGLILNGDFNIIEGKYDSVLARGDLTVLGGHLVTGSIYGGENSNINLLGGSIVASGNITAGYDINIGPGIEHLEAVYPGSGSSALLAKGSINIDPSLEIVIPKNPLIKRDGNYTYMYSVSSTGGYSKATRVVITRAYDLWVGGVRVTGANKDDILGDGGKAKYNPDTQELTLNNLTLTGAYPAEGSNAVIYSEMAGVILKGKATINAAGRTWGVYAGAASGGYDGELVINGDFTVTGATAYDLLSHGDLTVWDGDLTCGSMRSFRQNVRIRGGTVTATDSIMAEYNIYITNGIKKVDVAGTYSAFNAYGKTLSLGDELNIIEPDPAYILDGKVYDSSTDQIAKHVVIVNPNAFPLEITQQPTTAYGLVGDTVKFTVKATGYGELHYTWQYSDDWENWSTSSVTASSYSTKLTADRNGRVVRCIVTDELFNMTMSNTAVMYVSDLKITTQPKDYTGKEGSSAKFTVKASGGGLTYQWQVSDDNGKTWSNSSVKKDTYSTTLTAAKDGRMVRCIVKDSHGVKAISRAASMKLGPTITQQPKDYVGSIGDTAKITVTAEGAGLTYQWEVSDNNGESWSKSSIKTNTYSVKLTEARDGRLVRCIVTASNGVSVISDSARMKVSALTITTQPKNYTGAVNSTAKFTVAASGSGLTYQWQVSDDNGATWTNSSVKKDTYSTTLTAEKHGRMVRCIVKDSGGVKVISNAASMKISGPKITSQPKNYTGAANTTAKFTVAAQGTGLTYKWQYRDSGVTAWSTSSVKTATYSTTLTAARDGRQIRCIVSDSYGNSITSKTVSMTIG